MSLTANDIRNIDNARCRAADRGREIRVRLDYGGVCRVQPDGSLLNSRGTTLSLQDNADQLRRLIQRDDDTARFNKELRDAVKYYTETAQRYIDVGATDFEPLFKTVRMLKNATKRINTEIERLYAESETWEL